MTHDISAQGTAFDVSVTAQRLITANNGNLIAIWRLPPSPLLDSHAAPMQPLVQTFDGARLVAVEGDTVRVIDATSDASLSPPLHHPEAVAFADLAPDGDSLVTIAGRTVRVIDAKTWHLRGAPIVLPATPERVAFAQAAPVLVATMSAYEGDERRTLIQRIDLARGNTLDGPVRVEALQYFVMDATGDHALAATWSRTRPAVLERIALQDGTATCTPRLGDVWNSVLAADGRLAWLAVAAPGAQVAKLQHWDMGACRELPVAELTRLQPSSVLMARGDGLIVHRGGNEALIQFDGDGRRIAAVGEAIPGAMYDSALSVDGELAAIATRNGVHLLDARTGRHLSAPLTAPVAGDDAIAKLAFSPDGTRLIARTINQRWLFWNLPRITTSSADLARLVRALDPDPGEPLSDADVKALNVQLHASAAPPAPPAGSAGPVVFTPAAGAGVDPRFVPLDLKPAINEPLVGKTWAEPLMGGDLPTLAPGLQRFLGVDYRVDGGVQLSGGGTATALGPELRRSRMIAVPSITARRVHVLAFMHIPMSGKVPPRDFAHVVLIGTDGRETRLTIRTVRDVVTHGTNPKTLGPSARIAWVGMESESVRTGDDPAQPWSAVYAVALDVPPDTGPIRGLRFDVAKGRWKRRCSSPRRWSGRIPHACNRAHHRQSASECHGTPQSLRRLLARAGVVCGRGCARGRSAV